MRSLRSMKRLQALTQFVFVLPDAVLVALHRVLFLSAKLFSFLFSICHEQCMFYRCNGEREIFLYYPTNLCRTKTLRDNFEVEE